MLINLGCSIIVFLITALDILMQMNFDASVAQQKKIIIPNNYGEKLVGTLHETGSMEIVILCHGFRSTKVSDHDTQT